MLLYVNGLVKQQARGWRNYLKKKKKNPEERKKQSNVEEMTWQKDPQVFS